MLQRLHKSSVPAIALCSLLLAPVADVDAQLTPEPPFTYEFIVIDQASLDILGLDHAKAVWGDQDLDGDLDLLLSGLTNDGPITRLYINLKEEEFLEGDSLAWRHHYEWRSRGVTPYWLGDVAWIDANNDGLLEFTVSGSSSADGLFAPTTRTYAPVGTQYIPLPELDVIGVAGGSIDWGDYDNDGDPDLLLTGQRDDEIISRLFDNRDGVLFDSGMPLPLTSVGQAKFGDFDSDGDLDIILSAVYTASGFATKLLQNQAGTFEEVETDFPGLAFSSVDWGDYDNDGDLDLLLSGGVLGPLIVKEKTRVFRNDGQGAFSDIEAALDDAAFGTALWGDYDNDGFLDIVIAGGKGVTGPSFTRFYRNQGDDVFVPAINLAGIRYGALGFGDYDADGDLDVVVAGNGKMFQYRNDHRRVNNPPDPPTNLRTIKLDGGVTLAWDAADDTETPSPGLTYNIRVGTQPKSLDVVSPMSDVDTGHRMVADMGNVQNNTSWRIRDLPPGTYYWSVQAVDQSFQASPWAEEGVFNVSTSEKALVGLEHGEVPAGMEVVGAYPNPFDRTNTSATIQIRIGVPQFVRVTVFSALGEHVATLADEYLTSGVRRILWDGTSSVGGSVSDGVYFVRIEGKWSSRTIPLIRTGS